MYIDAYKDKDQIHVIERDKSGKKLKRDYDIKHKFYFEDPKGSYESINGVKCSKFETTKNHEYIAKLREIERSQLKHFEHGHNPIFRCLEENYKNSPTPNLNIVFLDIETDFHPIKGFADPIDPFNRITAITVYRKWDDVLATVVLKPDVPETDPNFLTFEEAEEITSKFENCTLCNDEEMLFEIFFQLIDDADLLSGWNSLGYDIPYLVNRCARILGMEQTKRFNAFDVLPKVKKYIKYGKERKSYDLVGRVHLDYLDLYQKHSQSEMSSYRLDYIGFVEVGEHKVQYDGTLDQLYKQDFEKFIEYNRQDVALLNKIDNKKKYIELANQMAHTNCVLIPTTMGSVALVDQAIINEAHSLNMVAPSRKDRFSTEEEPEDLDDDSLFSGAAVGAHVAEPKVGLHSEIGCCDINSLYPSTIRALNMGPETIIGQFRIPHTEKFITERIKSGMSVPEAWHNVFCLLEFDMIHNKTEDELTVDFEFGDSVTMSAKEWYNLIFDGGYILSANGTIFSKERKGIIPSLLERWYSERKTMKGYSESYAEMMEQGLKIDEDLYKLLAE